MRLIKKEDNVLLYEYEHEDLFGHTVMFYKILCPWGIFSTFDYHEAISKFNNWVEDLK